MTEHPWPESVHAPRGIAPGEMRLIRKLAGGGSLEELDAEDQAQASAFVALFRRFRDDDPNVLWEKAEWTALEPAAEPTPPNPTNTAG